MNRAIGLRPGLVLTADTRPLHCSHCGAERRFRLWMEPDEKGDLPVEGCAWLCPVCGCEFGVDDAAVRVALHTHPRVVVLESPYRPAPGGAPFDPTVYARACMLHSLNLGEAPLLSHLLYTQVLNDDDHDQRERGMSAGHAWIPVAHLVVFYVDHGFSEGMRRALAVAKEHGIEFTNRQLTNPTATRACVGLPLNATLEERDSEPGGNAPGARSSTAEPSVGAADPSTVVPLAQLVEPSGWRLPSLDELEAEESIVGRIADALMSAEPPGPFVFVVAMLALIGLAVMGCG